MARLSKKHKTAIVDVVTRWAHTISGARPFNLDRIREILHAAYKHETKRIRVLKKPKKNSRGRSYDWKNIKLGDPQIHVVHSPIAFRIASAVLRGQLSKEKARRCAALFELNPDFINSLRRDAMRGFGLWRHYYSSHAPINQVWDETLRDPLKAAQLVAFNVEPVERQRRGRDIAGHLRARMPSFERALTNLPEFDYSEQNANLVNNNIGVLTNITRERGSSAGTVTKLTFGNFHCQDQHDEALSTLSYVPMSSTVGASTFNRLELVPMRDSYYTSYVDSDLMLKIMGATDLQHTWRHELMHEATCVQTFCKSVLILAEAPATKRNASGELHCEDGPAVTWSDGAKQYYVDGHALGVHGKLICETPEKITLDHIRSERNEEVKRILIERYGWGKYLKEIGAKVIDRRENWVDNTVEALVEITETLERPRWGWRNDEVERVTIKQRKLILACRSTGRQYFLAVPDDIENCEAGQKWMGGGANTEHVPALAYPVRLVGAS